MYRYVKLLGDMMLAGAGLICLSPVLLLLWAAVRLTSPGPAIFKQNRIGKNKKIFQMAKFRTMRIDTPSEIPTHLLQDPYAYITPIGRFLRKSSLDELPQLWNIFKGDMSIVGPRPALWNQDDLIAERDRWGANAIRPGLTGLAQIRGRDELPIPEKAAHDGEYCKRMGFLFDCYIIWKTLFSVVSKSGIKEGAAK